MGLDARRGAGFPPDLYERHTARMENQAQRSRRAYFASRRRKLVWSRGVARCDVGEP